ncbi:MAG: hypothetical protein J5785_01130 [Spirochaetales bacterium]|nr:hypothetical protein [Spirochaetales bacterium]
MLVFWGDLVHYLYFVIAGIIAFFLVKNLFKREKRNGLVYDIVYAYCIIPFVLRILFIK